MTTLFANQLTGGTGTSGAGTTSNNAPQTVEATDGGGIEFSLISPTSTAGSSDTSTGGAPGGGGPSGGGSGPAGGPGPSGSSGPTSSGGTTSGSPGGGPGAGGGNAPPGQTPDSSDRALAVLSSPPPVTGVGHANPIPPPPRRPIIPGYVDQVQTPPVSKPGVPGIGSDFSSSGNAGRW
jgi:hypothetical protein